MWLYITYENMSVVYRPGIANSVAWNASGGATTAAVPSDRRQAAAHQQHGDQVEHERADERLHQRVHQEVERA